MGEAGLEKTFLDTLKKKKNQKTVESVGLTFVSLKDVYVISRRQDPELCEVVRPVVYRFRALELGKTSIRKPPHLTSRLRGGCSCQKSPSRRQPRTWARMGLFGPATPQIDV